MHKQQWCKHGMICGMRYAMHMHASERKDWTWPQLGKPRAPLERGVDSVELDIKITGIGCTDWKWQAKQIWHRSAINSTRPTKCMKKNKLLHSNIATKYMVGIHSRCLTKDEHWATASSQHIKLKQAWKKCTRLQVHRRWKTGHGRKQHQVAMFRARNQHATGT